MHVIESLRDEADASSAFAILQAAVGRGSLATWAPIAASPDARSPDEGLALLSAYVSIEAPDVRQAILDIVLAISNRSQRQRR